MDLLHHLKISTPLVWVQTQDIHEVETLCLANSDRDIYVFNPVEESLCVYDRKLGEYRTVLGHIDVDIWRPIDSPMNSLAYLVRKVKDSALFLIYNPVSLIEKSQDLLIGVYRSYLEAVQLNEADRLPLQVVLVSAGAKIPEELASITTRASIDPPDEQEIAKVITSYAQVDADLAAQVANKTDLDRFVKASLGLSRVKLMEALSLSIVVNSSLDAEYIDNYRKNLIKENGSLEIITPTQGFESIGGLESLKKLITRTKHSWEHPEELEKYGVKPIRRILLIGVPGSGKSAICKATAHTLGLDLVKFGVSKFMNKWIGSSEANARDAFIQINAMSPVVAWVDELGRDFSGSGSTGDSGTTDRVHGEVLTGIQELDDKVVLIGAANNIDGLPPEMLRAGRWDHIVFVGYPAVQERAEILRIHLGATADDFDIVTLAKKTALWTGAEIESVINKTRFEISYEQERVITTEDLLAAIKTEKNRLWLKEKSGIIEMYTQALEKFEWASPAQRADAEIIVAKATEKSAARKKAAAQGW